MAMNQMAESLVFCVMMGVDSVPVLSSPKAISAYYALANSATRLQNEKSKYVKDVANLYSHSFVDLKYLPPEALVDIRHDSKSFSVWQEFLQESIEETKLYSESDLPFDTKLKRSLERRGLEFEKTLFKEFGSTSYSSAFRFDSTNVVGFTGGLVASLVTGSGIKGALLAGSAALTAEKMFEIVKVHNRKLSTSLIRNHYHAFLPKNNITKL